MTLQKMRLLAAGVRLEVADGSRFGSPQDDHVGGPCGKRSGKLTVETVTVSRVTLPPGGAHLSRCRIPQNTAEPYQCRTFSTTPTGTAGTV
eukprot:3136391-Rhodomonas_salina.1